MSRKRMIMNVKIEASAIDFLSLTKASIHYNIVTQKYYFLFFNSL